MAVPEIVPATIHHAAIIAANIRPDDKAELAACGYKPLPAILVSLNASTHAWTGMVDGEPICIFGVSPWGDDTGRPWMVGTEQIVKHQKIFLRYCKKCVAIMQDNYSLLHNYVDDRNLLAVKWLKWLGFKFDEATPYGPDGLPFLHFYMGE